MAGAFTRLPLSLGQLPATATSAKSAVLCCVWFGLCSVLRAPCCAASRFSISHFRMQSQHLARTRTPRLWPVQLRCRARRENTIPQPHQSCRESAGQWTVDSGQLPSIEKETAIYCEIICTFTRRRRRRRQSLVNCFT